MTQARSTVSKKDRQQSVELRISKPRFNNFQQLSTSSNDPLANLPKPLKIDASMSPLWMRYIILQTTIDPSRGRHAIIHPRLRRNAIRFWISSKFSPILTATNLSDDGILPPFALFSFIRLRWDQLLTACLRRGYWIRSSTFQSMIFQHHIIPVHLPSLSSCGSSFSL